MKKIILGHLRDMRLTEARQECNRLKTLRAEGRDPLAQRCINAEKESSRLQAARQAVAATRTAVLAQREVAQRDKTDCAPRSCQHPTKTWR